MKTEPQILRHVAGLEGELLKLLLLVAILVAVGSIFGAIHGLREGVPVVVAWLALAGSGASLLAGIIIWYIGV